MLLTLGKMRKQHESEKCREGVSEWMKGMTKCGPDEEMKEEI